MGKTMFFLQMTYQTEDLPETSNIVSGIRSVHNMQGANMDVKEESALGRSKLRCLGDLYAVRSFRMILS